MRSSTRRFGRPYYTRIDTSSDAGTEGAPVEAVSGGCEGDGVGGGAIVGKLTRAPANDAAIGGLKVETEHGWFAARPSGTEEHLQDLRGKLQE